MAADGSTALASRARSATWTMATWSKNPDHTRIPAAIARPSARQRRKRNTEADDAATPGSRSRSMVAAIVSNEISATRTW
jgi:hypothetical protein